jgi:integrase
MTGSVTKYTVSGSSRPKWRYRLRLGKDESGRDLRDGAGGFTKESEALNAMRDRIKEIEAERNAVAAPQSESLGEWLTKWIDRYGKERCTLKTLERYRQLAGYVTDGGGELAAIAKLPLAAVKPAALESALYGLLRAPGKRRKHVSARTVRHVAGLLNVALNKAFRLELIAVNPMLRVELPSVERSQARSLTADEITALRGATRGHWAYALIELGLSTGARRGELLALQWSDIDWTKKAVVISKSLEQTGAGLRVKATKTERPRVCALPHAAVVALQFQRDQQAEHKRQFGKDYRDGNLVFCEPSGEHLQPDLVSQVVVRRMQKAGITNASMHTLRHTHASNLLSQGVPVSAVSARLGHSDQTTTMRIYSHALPDDDRRAADAWDTISGRVQ